MPTCLPIFLDRLRNEITRLTTVKALTKVAASPLHIDLSPIIVSTPQNIFFKVIEEIYYPGLFLTHVVFFFCFFLAGCCSCTWLIPEEKSKGLEIGHINIAGHLCQELWISAEHWPA